MEEKDTVRDVKSEDVITAHFLSRFVDGERKKTPLIVLTFGKSVLSKEIRIGYEICHVRPFISSPHGFLCARDTDIEKKKRPL